VSLATYFFASEENKERFDADPDKYAPQHGGYCSHGVSKGALAPVDIKTAQVYKGKLYLNLNGEVLGMFNANIDEEIAEADANFPSLVEKHAT
jgi:hypothetical protein